MARATQVTKLSLDRWAQIMGVNPLHFNGVTIPALGQRTCDATWFQYSWQNDDGPSREDVAHAIAEAEASLEGMLGWSLVPSWEEDEWHATNRPYDRRLFNIGGYDIRSFREAIPTNKKHFLAGGVRSSDLVSAAAAIAWSDPDGDGYTETGTITVATTALNSCELHVYYPGKSGAPRWEVRPVQVTSLAGGNATITFRRELCVLEVLQEAIDNSEVPVADGLDDADFLTTVDVYRVYNDPQRQVQLLWEPYGLCTDCSGTGCATCAYATQWGCLHARGERDLGQVVYSPATWVPATKTFTAVELSIARQPDAVRLWYYAGWRGPDDCPDTEMDPLWARAVAHYAAALLDRPPCNCNQARFEHWQSDLAAQRGAEELEIYNLSSEDLACPFGTRRGAIAAWKMVSGYSYASAPWAILA